MIKQIWHVLPRGMRHDIVGATSIDLYVSEMAAKSRYPTRIYAHHGDEPLPAADLKRLPEFRIADTFRRARYIAREARGPDAPDVVIVQQHLPCAARIARSIDAPVILQKHNFVRPPRPPTLAAELGRRRHVAQFQSLRGITFVSRAVLEDFERHWPDVTIPRCVIPNGFDVAAWRPAERRTDEILVVGRATPEKGLVEAALGVTLAIERRLNWRTTFVVSESVRDPAYMSRVRAALSPLGERGRIFENLRASEVCALNEQAAIALIPSIWREPFGRTCLEAHAGGAAVITSGLGGLKEISENNALYLPAINPGAIALSLSSLIDDPPKRQKISRAGRLHVERMFDLRSVSRLLDIFCARSAVLGKY